MKSVVQVAKELENEERGCGQWLDFEIGLLDHAYRKHGIDPSRVAPVRAWIRHLRRWGKSSAHCRTMRRLDRRGDAVIEKLNANIDAWLDPWIKHHFKADSRCGAWERANEAVCDAEKYLSDDGTDDRRAIAEVTRARVPGLTAAYREFIKGPAYRRLVNAWRQISSESSKLVSPAIDDWHRYRRAHGLPKAPPLLPKARQGSAAARAH